jgi:hypothetical protein
VGLSGQEAQEVAQAIGLALREERDRPVGDLGNASYRIGTVGAVYPDGSYVDVTLDGDADPSHMQAAAVVMPGDRVIVLFVPPSGAYVLGALTAIGTADFGMAFGGTTDAAGRLVVPAGVNYVPAWAVANLSSAGFVQVESIGVDGVHLRAWKTDGTGTINVASIAGFVHGGL